MPILLDPISVIVRRTVIAKQLKGGSEAFFRIQTDATKYCDNELCLVGFARPDIARGFVAKLQEAGLIFQRKGQGVHIAVVDQLHGMSVSAPWLSTGALDLFEPRFKVEACWPTAHKSEGIRPLSGWKCQDSPSGDHCSAPEGPETNRPQLLRGKSNKETCPQGILGQEQSLRRPRSHIETEAALLKRLQKLCHYALELTARSEPFEILGDEAGALATFKEMQGCLLAEARKIATGHGHRMALAHYSHGLVLRILHRIPEAASAFRKANELCPGVIHTLRELVRCLSEQGDHLEALFFARQAVEAKPRDAEAWCDLAMCLIQTRQRKEARRAIRKAVALDPDDLESRYINQNFSACFKACSKTRPE